MPSDPIARFDRAARALGAAVVILAAASVAVAFFLPVYTDEVVWKALLGRIGYDGAALSLMLEPSCGPYSFPVPLPLLPFRWLDQILNAPLVDPLAVRAMGFVLGAGWLLFATLAAARVAGPRHGRLASSLMLAAATLGAMPFFLVVSRPDQFLLWGMTAFLLLLLRPAPPPPALWLALARGAGGALACCFLLAEHPRALFALPLMLAFLWRVVRRPWLASGAAAVVVAFAALAYRDWSTRWACPGDPALAQIYVGMNLGNAIADGQLPHYLHALAAQLLRPVGWYLSEFALRSHYDGGIMPGLAHPVLGGPIEIVFGLLLAAGFAAFIHRCMALRREREDWLAVAAVASLWLFYLAEILTRVAKQDYEAELVQPVMAEAALASLWLAAPRLFRTARPAFARLARAGALILLGTSVASQAWLVINDAPLALRRWTEPGYPAGQPFSVSAFGYGRLEPEILATARQCGIDAARRPRHLVVDELTYFAFRAAPLPLFVTYFENSSWGSAIPDPVQVWESVGSAGMIVGCARVEPRIAAGVLRNGLFCCHPAWAH
jgi:hypothetical protein